MDQILLVKQIILSCDAEKNAPGFTALSVTAPPWENVYFWGSCAPCDVVITLFGHYVELTSQPSAVPQDMMQLWKEPQNK